MSRYTGFVLALLFVPSPAFAQEEGGESKKPAAPAEGKKAGKKKAQGAKAGAADPAAAPGEGLSAQQRAKIKKAMRRQAQSGNLTGLTNTVEAALKGAHPEKDRDILKDAAFYKAGLCGKANDEKGCFEWIEKAIGYGNLGVDGFENSSLIPDSIKSSSQFRERMDRLRKEAEGLVWEEFTKDVKKQFADPQAFSLPPPHGVGSRPFNPADLGGRPLGLVVSPAFHDGLEKELPYLESLAKKYEGKVAFAVLFYQYYDDSDREKRTVAYVERAKMALPAGIITRDYERTLGIPFFPSHFFVSSEGKLVYRRDGSLLEKEAEHVLGELARTAPAAVEKPKETPVEKPKEAAPAEKPTETPAVKPAEEKKEAPPEKPAEKSDSEKEPSEKN